MAKPTHAGLLTAALAVSMSTAQYYIPSNTPTTGTCNVIPFGDAGTATWQNQIYQTLATSADLGNTASLITGIGFAPCGTGIHRNSRLTIRLSHVPANYVLSSSFAANLPNPVTVLEVADQAWRISANQWNVLGLSTPFAYDGVSDVVMEVIAEGNTNTGSAGMRRDTRSRVYAAGWTGTPPATGTVAAGALKWSLVTTPVYATWPVQDANVGFGCTYAPNATSAGGTAELRAVTAGPDHLFQSWWYYRLDNDPREHTFNASAGQLSEMIAEGTASIFWANVDNRGIEARLCITPLTTGANAGMCAQSMTITNTNTVAVRVNLFSYADFDVCQTANNTASSIASHHHEVVGSCGVRCYYRACGADRFEANAYPLLRNRLTDAQADDLADQGLPMSGDYTGGFQWRDRVLQPDESFTANVVLGVDFSIPTCAEASAEIYCQGKEGTYGPSVWRARPPALGTADYVDIRGGLPGASPVLMLAAAEACLPFFAGTLAVQPQGAFSMPLPPFDTRFLTGATFNIPVQPTFAGLSLYMQSFWLDPGAVGSVAHTAGMAWIFGSSCCGHPRIRVKAGTTETIVVAGFLGSVKTVTSKNPRKCTAVPSGSRPDAIDITGVAGAHGPTHLEFEYNDGTGKRCKGCLHVRVVP